MLNTETLYYNGATQVKYFHNGTYHGAIAYHDFLIDGASAQMIYIQKILDEAARIDMPLDVAIIEFDWIDLNDIILYGKASD